MEGASNCRILPILFDVLNSNNQEKNSEVIDAIGFLLFYNPNYANEHFFKVIINTLNKYSENNLIIWKCVVCLFSFKTQSSVEVLNQVMNGNKNDTIKCEAKRSKANRLEDVRDIY